MATGEVNSDVYIRCFEPFLVSLSPLLMFLPVEDCRRYLWSWGLSTVVIQGNCHFFPVCATCISNSGSRRVVNSFVTFWETESGINKDGMCFKWWNCVQWSHRLALSVFVSWSKTVYNRLDLPCSLPTPTPSPNCHLLLPWQPCFQGNRRGENECVSWVINTPCACTLVTSVTPPRSRHTQDYASTHTHTHTTLHTNTCIHTRVQYMHACFQAQCSHRGD